MTATLERPSRTTKELMPAVRAELRARKAPPPASAGGQRLPFGSRDDDHDARPGARVTVEARP